MFEPEEGALTAHLIVKVFRKDCLKKILSIKLLTPDCLYATVRWCLNCQRKTPFKERQSLTIFCLLTSNSGPWSSESLSARHIFPKTSQMLLVRQDAVYIPEQVWSVNVSPAAGETLGVIASSGSFAHTEKKSHWLWEADDGRSALPSPGAR